MQEIVYLGGGCFWGVQAYFDLIKGILKTQVGYANSKIKFPSYKLVCSEKTGAVEAVEIVFNNQIINLEKILERFFSIIDPTTLNYQGNDIGTQYRSGIYTKDPNKLENIKKFVRYTQKNFAQKIVTEIQLLENFYPAENYHQKYLEKNPDGYCHINLQKIKNDINLR